MKDFYVVVYKGKGAVQPWRFTLRGANNEPVAQSEGYFSKWNAKRAARRAFGDDVVIREG